MSYETFLSPGKIGNLELKNRCIFPPMGTSFAINSEVGSRTINYHVRRVQGGCAMNIVEIASVHYTSSSLTTPGIHDDKFIPGLTRLAAAIKEAGGAACIQLWHGGRQTSGKPFGGQPWAPSAIPCPMIQEMPHAMTKEEIWEIVHAYGDAALRAKTAGFDAVELHGAHGYLIDCFLNPYSNTRTDEYGGIFENRIRFGLEVIAEVRSKVGKNFPVLIRMSLSENVEGGIQVEDGLKAAKRYEQAGVDALDISQGCYGAIPYTVPPYFLPIGVNVSNAALVKKNVKIPVIVAGRINTPDMAEEILKSGGADFISLGRGQLADPDFVNKAAANKGDEIVRCIACDQGCVGRAFSGEGVSCVFNPSTGDEANVIIEPAAKKKNILVIGGGPAGLEAARVAAQRGHSVILFEKTAKLGGQFLIAGFAPHKEYFTEAAIHMGYRAQKAGVNIRLYTEASAENIRAVNPEEIIIAAGSEPIIPQIPGIDGSNVYEARGIIGSNNYVAEENIVVIGGGLVGLEAMEILTNQGKKVAVVEMLGAVGKDMEMYIIPYVMAFLKDHKISVHTNSKCIEIGGDHIVIEKDGKIFELSCEAVVTAMGAKSNRRIEEVVKSIGVPYHIIGDAQKPAKILNAIWQGNQTARMI
jgi:2,4-dienoyl-CoA reductase-like NADH-dependent reductase (Old Yellow Enzyme family)/thioredoxin reductase